MKTDRLEQAIYDAVAATAAPDESRLAAILVRLEQAPISRPPPRSAWPWLLLAAAGAAAAGGGYWYARITWEPTADRNTDTAPAELSAPSPAAEPAATSAVPGRPKSESDNNEQQRNPAVIYRR